MTYYICPVCGFDKLDEEPYDLKGRGNFDICACCRFQYGVTDDDKGYSFEDYRKKWLKNGAKWFIKGAKPTGWDLKKQLHNINVEYNISELKD